MVGGRCWRLPLSSSGGKKGDNSSPETMTVSDAFCSVAAFTTLPLIRNPSQMFLRAFDDVSADAGVNTQRPNRIS